MRRASEHRRGAVWQPCGMASTAAAASSTPAIEVPPLPPKLRPKPQRRQIGAGKPYANEAEFQVDLNKYECEQEDRQKLVMERERAKERLREQTRDRSSRQRDSADNTDSQRRVRARQEQRVAEGQEKDELEAQIQRARERGIASGELLPIQRERLQFRDDAEAEHYDVQCGPCGCPYADPVFFDMQLYGHDADSPQWHVRVRLFRRRDVRVQGKVVGYGAYSHPVRRVDTCMCSSCEKTRREEVFSEQAHGTRPWSEFGDA